MSARVVYLDGRFLAPDEPALVSLFDRGYLLGDSIFETLRAYRGVAFAFDAHAERLESAAHGTGISLPANRETLRGLVAEGLARLGVASAYVRITVSRGEGGVGIATAGCAHPIMSIVLRETNGYPSAAYEHGIETSFVGPRKVPAACLDPKMKTGTYLPQVLARRELERSGMLEGIQLSVDGMVVSGLVSNVFAIRHGVLCTPGEASGCRTGVTREIILDVASSMGIATEALPITPDAVLEADELFFASTLMECLPVSQLGARKYASARPDSATRRVHRAFDERVRAYVEAELGRRS